MFDMRTQGIDRSIAGLAERQFGVVFHDQLSVLGLSTQAVERRVLAGRLHRLHQLVYAVGHRNIPREGRWLAAVFACGPGAVLSGPSAAALWALWRGDAQVTVTVPVASPRRHAGVTVRRCPTMDEGETTTRRDIPVTTVARTLLDLAAHHPRRLGRAVERAEQERVFDLREVEAVLDRHRGRPGTRRLCAAIAAWRPAPLLRSDLERRFHALCERHGLPRPQVNTTLLGYEVDFLWPDEGLIVEVDGPHHATPTKKAADGERDAILLVEGFRTLRFGEAQLASAPATVERALSRRRGAPAPRGSSSRGS